MAEQRWESSLDGVRGLAAAGVIAFHCYFYLAVQLPVSGLAARLLFLAPQCLTAFFVLSGFLLFRPYVEAAAGRRPVPSTRTLYRRRFWRVYPGHTVIFLIACVLLPYGYTQVGQAHGRLGVGGDLANLLLVQGYHPDLVLSGLGASWSMVPEVAFYALLPAFGWVAVRIGRRWGALAVALPLLPLLAVGWVVRDYAFLQQGRADADLGSWAPVLFYSFPAIVDLFAAGMLAAVVLTAAEPASRRRIAVGLLLVGAAAAVVMDIGIPGNTLVALGCGGLYVLLSDAEAGGGAIRALRRFLGWRPLRFLGRLSYASYLWHLPVVHVVAIRLGDGADTVPEALGVTAVVFAATYLLAWVTTVLVVEPGIRIGHGRRVSVPTR